MIINAKIEDHFEAEEKAESIAIHGQDAIIVYDDGSTDQTYKAIIADNIIAEVGNDCYENMMQSADELGYEWFQNIQDGDQLVIREAIEIYG